MYKRIYIYIYIIIYIYHTHIYVYIHIHSTYDIEVFNIEYWLVVFTYFCFKPGTGMTKPFWTHFRCFLSGNHQGGTSKIHRFKSRFGGFLSHRGTPKSSISLAFSWIFHSVRNPFWGTPILGNLHVPYKMAKG